MKNDFILLEHLKVLQQKLSSTEVPNRPKYLNESSLQITNISGESKFKGKQFSPKYFVLHHTGGRGTASDVVRILNCRHYNGSSKCTTLGIQWIIDRDGKLYQSLPKGSKGAHLRFQKDGMGHVTNSTSEGVEIVGLNNDDILIKQCKTALLLIKSLGHSLSNVYGHGDVSTNKNANEGKRCKTYVTKYWNTPEDQLPEVDDEVGVWVDQKDKKDKKDKKDQKDQKDQKDNVTTTTTTTDTSKSSTNDDDKTNPKKGGFLDFFKNFGGIFKEEEEEVSKIQEDVQRIKNLLK
jgi:N-acetyl-anhydromuramyl-L-alanine amidase AmpD